MPVEDMPLAASVRLRYRNVHVKSIARMQDASQQRQQWQQQKEVQPAAVTQTKPIKRNWLIDLTWTLRSSDEDQRKRFYALAELTKDVQQLWPTAQLRSYGSVAAGIALKNSDWDLALQGVPPFNQLYRERAKRILYLLSEHNQWKWETAGLKCTRILQARVPILHLQDTRSGLEYDVSLDGDFGHDYKTQLIKQYMAIDFRVLPLVILVKHWAKQRAIDDATAGTLPSFGYTLMVLNFLQQAQPPLLPVLHKNENAPHPWHKEAAETNGDAKRPSPTGAETAGAVGSGETGEASAGHTHFWGSGGMHGWVLRGRNLKDFKSVEEARTLLKQAEGWDAWSLSTLLCGFFRFYSKEWDMEKHVISVRTGRFLPSMCPLPPENHPLRGGTLRPRVGRPPMRHLQIEDPYDPWDNVGRGIAVDTAVAILSELNRAHDLLEPHTKAQQTDQEQTGVPDSVWEELFSNYKDNSLIQTPKKSSRAKRQDIIASLARFHPDHVTRQPQPQPQPGQPPAFRGEDMAVHSRPPLLPQGPIFSAEARALEGKSSGSGLVASHSPGSSQQLDQAMGQGQGQQQATAEGVAIDDGASGATSNTSAGAAATSNGNNSSQYSSHPQVVANTSSDGYSDGWMNHGHGHTGPAAGQDRQDQVEGGGPAGLGAVGSMLPSSNSSDGYVGEQQAPQQHELDQTEVESALVQAMSKLSTSGSGYEEGSSQSSRSGHSNPAFRSAAGEEGAHSRLTTTDELHSMSPQVNTVQVPAPFRLYSNTPPLHPFDSQFDRRFKLFTSTGNFPVHAPPPVATAAPAGPSHGHGSTAPAPLLAPGSLQQQSTSSSSSTVKVQPVARATSAPAPATATTTTANKPSSPKPPAAAAATAALPARSHHMMLQSQSMPNPAHPPLYYHNAHSPNKPPPARHHHAQPPIHQYARRPLLPTPHHPQPLPPYAELHPPYPRISPHHSGPPPQHGNSFMPQTAYHPGRAGPHAQLGNAALLPQHWGPPARGYY
eukprot:g9627.t1